MLNIVLLIGSYFFMEFVAWSNHKYIMHGFLWKWHKDHHVNDQRKVSPGEVEVYTAGVEKNDLFFIVYAIPGILLIVSGLFFHVSALVFSGVGIALYGFTYFLIHDVVIHQRIKIPFLQNMKNRYIRAIVNAHLAHHRPKSANDFRNFGLLIFPLRFFKN